MAVWYVVELLTKRGEVKSGYMTDLVMRVYDEIVI